MEGSTDRTISVARRIATHVITSRVGRAEQMNAGAKKSYGGHSLVHACRQQTTQTKFQKND